MDLQQTQLLLRLPFRNLVRTTVGTTHVRLHNRTYVVPTAGTTFVKLHFNKFAAPIADATFVLKYHRVYCLVAGQLHSNIFFFSFLVCSDLTALRGDVDKCALFKVCVLDEYGY